MKSMYGLFFLVFIIVCLFGAIRPVHAVEPTHDDFLKAWPVSCAEPPMSENGEILVSTQIDYYSIDLVAGQVVIIDVDAEKIGSKLDSLLEVFDANLELVAASDQSTDTPPVEEPTEEAHRDMPPISADPYLELTVPPNGDGTYLIALSAANPDDTDFNTGIYTLYLTCSNAIPVEPLKVGDLLGVTPSVNGPLLTINPGDASGTLRYPLDIGPIADVEFDPRTTVLFAAIDATGEDLSSIATINPNTGVHSELFKVDSGGVVALELAGDTLYGVHASVSEQFSLVMIDQTTGTLETVVPPFSGPVWSLAYHSSSNTLYAVVSGDESKNELVKIDLASPEVQTVGTTGLGQVVALDFSHEDILYGVDRVGNLFIIPDLKTGTAEIINPITFNDVNTPLSGLTFVVGYTPPVDPIKTICSSSFTASTTTSAESASPTLSRFKIKNNPLHSAVGLFKFYGTFGESVTVTLALEEESVESDEDCPLEGLEGLWPSYQGKGRVFLGLRDKIDGYDLRVRKKDSLPLSISADLEADGWYYIMVIRPLPRLYRAEYCLTLESNMDGSESLTTLEVAWPGDNSEEVPDTSAELKVEEPPLDDGVAVEKSLTYVPDSGTTLYETASVSLETTVSDESTVKTLSDPEAVPDMGTQVADGATEDESGSTDPQAPSADTPLNPETVAASGSEDPQPAADSTVDESDATNPDEYAAQSSSDGESRDTPVADETTAAATGEVVAPAEEPAPVVTEEPAVMGAAEIGEETTANETGEVAPDQSTDEISGDDGSADLTGSAEVIDNNSDGAESVEGDTGNLAEEDPTDLSKS